jgi:sialate O-acetylesterase
LNLEPSNIVIITNILVGEVWLGSGQSNMAYPVKNFINDDHELQQVIKQAPFRDLRLYGNEGWQNASTDRIDAFSALLFSFGHALQQELKVPVGLMCGARNGTPSGRWMTEEMAVASPAFMQMFQAKSGYSSFEAFNADYKSKRDTWKAEVAQAKDAGEKPPRFVFEGQPLGGLYGSYIQPLVPYAIRGVLWDQGESGTAVPGVDQYTTMNALIAGWRKAWINPDLPFLHMQKPSGGGCSWDAEYETICGKAPLQWVPLPQELLPDDRKCEFNLEHIRIGTIKNAPLVTTSDLTPGIHPRHKYHYGRRASQVALGSVYGRDMVTCGPVYESHKIQDRHIVIKFKNVGKGLVYRHGDTLQGFEIAGEDRVWKWADARIDGDAVLVSHPQIKAPRYVRYAFARTFNWANLFNTDEWPALMFTTEMPK